MIESAPLQNTVIQLWGDLKTEVILLRADVKSITYCKYHFCCIPFTEIITELSLFSLEIKTYPQNLAAFTKASSSGLEAQYYPWEPIKTE